MIESLACAGASLILGAYLASSADSLFMKVIMLSFPPAALLMALRRNRVETTDQVVTFQPAPEPTTFSEVAAGLEFDILTRAS